MSIRTKRIGAKHTFFKKLFTITSILICILCVFYYMKEYVKISNYTYESKDIPKSFVGYKIANISNINNSTVDILNKLSKQDLDIVIVTGGYADTNGNIENSINLLNELGSKYTTYFIFNDSDNNCRDKILSKVTNAKCIEDTGIELKPRDINAEAFIKNYVSEKVIEDINNKNEEAIQYLQYIKLEIEDTAKKVELVGLKKYEQETDAEQDLLNKFKIKKYEISLVAIGQEDMIDAVINTQASILISGLGNKVNNSTFTSGGTQIFNTSGMQYGLSKKHLINIPEIQVITLSDGTIKNRSIIDKVLSKYNSSNTDDIYTNDSDFIKYLNNQKLAK